MGHPAESDHERAGELLRLRRELQAVEERRKEEALKLLGEVSDRRHLGCFWMLVSIFALIGGAVAWAARYPLGSSSTLVWALVGGAAVATAFGAMRLRQASRADELAERAIAEFDAEASEIRDRIEAAEPGAGKAGPE